MACNGHNHAPDCPCNFRGGHPNTSPPTIGRWGEGTIRSFLKKPNARCHKCGAAVWWIGRGQKGGFYSDDPGPPWKKHPCTDQSRTYKPYNKHGRPKLRNRRSTYEKDGWTPFIVKKIEISAVGSIIQGTFLGSPHAVFLGFLSEINADITRPIYFRENKSEKGDVEMNFFCHEELEANSLFGFSNCQSHLELAAKQAARTKKLKG